jgi:hypothetical protein
MNLSIEEGGFAVVDSRDLAALAGVEHRVVTEAIVRACSRSPAVGHELRWLPEEKVAGMVCEDRYLMTALGVFYASSYMPGRTEEAMRRTWLSLCALEQTEEAA